LIGSARKEFDFTCKEVAEDRELSTIAGLSYKDKDGKIKHNPEREMIQDMDTLPWVADVYKRDLQIEKYFTAICCIRIFLCIRAAAVRRSAASVSGRKRLAGTNIAVRSPQNVADEMAT